MAVSVRGRVVVTAQLLKEMLGLPKEVEIVGLGTDPAWGMLDVILRSEEPIPGVTFGVAEGQEAPCSSIASSIYGYDGMIPQAHVVIYERVRNLLVGTVDDDSMDWAHGEPVDENQVENGC